MAKKVILLANLGSPDSTKVSDVRSYLDEFLMDERVIDLPYPLRYALVKGIITPLRAPASAKKYQTIWTEKGSPLITITDELTTAVEAHCGIPAYMCMRYGNPSPEMVLHKIKSEHPDVAHIIVLPLYPHYAMSSYETAMEAIKRAFLKEKFDASVSYVNPFYKHPAYIKALSESIRPYLVNSYDHVLFSYHGIPERHVRKTDSTHQHCLKQAACCHISSPAHAFCYRHQVMETTTLTANDLAIPPGKYSSSFQSRLGNDQWLKPYTAELLKQFPKQGIKDLLVVCPAFVSDCLETLEEIHVEGKELFMSSGGKSFRVVPCLNTNAQWVQAITELINQSD